jgi:hypothetical protein
MLWREALTAKMFQGRSSDFAISDFGFRISDFNFNPQSQITNPKSFHSGATVRDFHPLPYSLFK